MNVNQVRLTAQARVGRKPHKSVRLFMAIAVLFLMSVPALGGSPKHGRKIAPDFANFPVNPDGTVDVIIQFNDVPQSRHFQMMSSHNGKLKAKFEQIKGAAYRIPVSLLSFLENHPDVAYVSPDRVNKPSFDETSPAVLADVARQQYGLDGSGVGIAVIDSGVYSHDDLNKADGSGSRVVYSESFVSGDPNAADAYGHGTHVAGIVAGNGADSQIGYTQQHLGIAPGANIINLRVLDQNGGGPDSQVIAAIQRAIQLKDTYNIRIINLSLGRPVFESYTVDPLCQAVEAAWNAGIVVVVAAGNSGRDNSMGTQGYSTIDAPGNDPSVITVGAMNEHGTAVRDDDTISTYSSKGPTLVDHIVKPDLVAPGNNIVSLLAPGSTLAAELPGLVVEPPLTCSGSICTTGNSEYLTLSGTSMATPVVSGAAALMLQADPSLTPDTIKARMMKTAWKNFPANGFVQDAQGNSYFEQYDAFTVGAGYLDVDAVLANTDVANSSATSPTAVLDPVTGQVSLANSPSISGGASIWNNSIAWGDSMTWGDRTVISDSILWGDAAVWNQAGTAGFSITWSDTITWGDAITWGDTILWGD